MKNIMDLHIHSCYSEDGEYSPSTLVQMCSDSGIKSMAIADHNTVAGVEEALKKAEQLQVNCYPAIEIDCCYEGVNFHVLGYGINYKSIDFSIIEENIKRQCKKASVERLNLINKLGFSLTEKDLTEITVNTYWSEHWTGEMFAEVLLDKREYLTSDILKPYREGGRRSDNPYVNFYWDYCSQGKPCYVEIEFPDIKEVIDIIHRNNGIAILAHPGVNLKNRYEMLDRLIPLGLDGLEAFSSYHDVVTTRWFYNKAIEKGMSVTRGSDFHGKNKPSIKLGQYHCI